MSRIPKSLPRICVALGLPAADELSQAAEREYKNGTRLFEFRLDYLPDANSGVRLVREFRSKYPDTYILATCRHAQNHGRFRGDIGAQLAILKDAATAGAVALDLEIESAERAQSGLAALRDAAALLLSHHDFEGTPTFATVLRRLTRVPADAYKIAVTARKPGDNLRLFEFVRTNRRSPLVAFAMSETGLATRVLTPSMGCLFTYAAPDADEGTAPGQVAASVMRSLYRCEKLTRQTRVYGVIADPVAHSKSPLIHNRALQARRIDAVYLPFLVARSCLAEWMKLARALPVAGFSVTIPHKQRMLRHLDTVDTLSKRIGAVNTVWRKAGKWRGTNTDVEGVLKPLGRHLRLARTSVLIAGYGGAARAAAIALSDAGAKVTITGRNLTAAQELARVARADVVTLDQAQKFHFDALVHATPVGMYPNAEACLFRDRIPADLVLDMVYNPAETLLLKRAKQQGLSVIPGAQMLIEQAARQFELWTGESAPRSVMQSALDQHTQAPTRAL
jgi:3-dehydroquinate dehydratase / shikimate dehydrogenase